MSVSRRAAWLTVLTVLPMLLTILAGIALLNSTDLKPRLIKAVQDATGRTLHLNGPLRVTWSLWPTVEVNDVTLANLLGGSRPDIAHAERIEAQLSLPALLWHRIEIHHLTLIGPNILFEQVGGSTQLGLCGIGARARRTECVSGFVIPASHPQRIRQEWHGDLALSGADKSHGDPIARSPA